ncbi:MAG: hypothetical protein AAB787_01955 [Patescibacteria group bacterium]
MATLYLSISALVISCFLLGLYITLKRMESLLVFFALLFGAVGSYLWSMDRIVKNFSIETSFYWWFYGSTITMIVSATAGLFLGIIISKRRIKTAQPQPTQ